MFAKLKEFFFGKPKELFTQPEAAPYKVEPKVELTSVVATATVNAVNVIAEPKELKPAVKAKTVNKKRTFVKREETPGAEAKPKKPRSPRKPKA